MLQMGLDALFKRFDADDSGELDEVEFTRAVRQDLQVSTENLPDGELQAMFGCVDDFFLYLSFGREAVVLNEATTTRSSTCSFFDYCSCITAYSSIIAFGVAVVLNPDMPRLFPCAPVSSHQPRRHRRLR